MTGVALWLLLLGTLDLFRAHHDETSRARRFVLAGVGAWTTVVLALASDPAGRGWWGWLAVGVSVALWVPASGTALGRARRSTPPPAPGLVGERGVFVTAYAALALGFVGAVVCGPGMVAEGRADRLLEGTVLAEASPERLLVVAGVLLVQVSTANVVVRLLLDLVGVPAHDNEKQLRGGRVLGPMERIVVVGLGVAGSLTAASLVIAAKALLRFPELRTPGRGQAPHGGPSDVTEYFLVGSMASWLVALGGIALVAAV
ncbi:hypothetical protein RDV89_04415 [Nocardioides zeae]|uniref:Uncharacterized protein n=1 Tax=Nocardioides imazamoxiresistens TaxID=3231893 RepID=A0ABU3PSS8_9ACTN|nr:hypothetical protein [Nocardioides zeae]MDT9592295.1 hypothetical protein [Nocardioides zeae]